MAWFSRRPTFPTTIRQLKAWLRDTTVGRALMVLLTSEALENKCRACENPQLATKPRVLVVVRRLGLHPGVEVYYENGVNVRLEELVDTKDDAAVEALADELLAVQLPRYWQHLQTSCRSQSMVFTGLTAERRTRSLEELRILRELKKKP